MTKRLINKSEWIRKQPKLSAKELVEKAKKEGFTLSLAQVYTARSTAATKTKAAPLSEDQRTFMQLVTRIGTDRAQALLSKLAPTAAALFVLLAGCSATSGCGTFTQAASTVANVVTDVVEAISHAHEGVNQAQAAVALTDQFVNGICPTSASSELCVVAHDAMDTAHILYGLAQAATGPALNEYLIQIQGALKDAHSDVVAEKNLRLHRARQRATVADAGSAPAMVLPPLPVPPAPPAPSAPAAVKK